MKNFLGLLLCASLLIACHQDIKKDKEIVRANAMDMPAWALKSPDLCGVGIQKIRNDIGAAKTVATSRGTTSLSRQLESKVADMIKNYNQEGGDTSGDISESLSTVVSKTLSKQTIQGAIPEKVQPLDGQMYVLVCLKPNMFTQKINEMKLLSDAQRKKLTIRAQQAEAELAEAMKTYN